MDKLLYFLYLMHPQADVGGGGGGGGGAINSYTVCAYSTDCVCKCEITYNNYIILL